MGHFVRFFSLQYQWKHPEGEERTKKSKAIIETLTSSFILLNVCGKKVIAGSKQKLVRRSARGSGARNGGFGEGLSHASKKSGHKRPLEGLGKGKSGGKTVLLYLVWESSHHHI